MRTFLWTACLVLTSISVIRADSPDPLRLVPDRVDLFVKIEKPRYLIESILKLEPIQDLLKLHFSRQLLDSHQARIAFDLLHYFEKELKADWPKLLDQLAGNGIVLAAKGDVDGKPAVALILQGSDAKLTQQFSELFLQVMASELNLADAGIHRQKQTIEGIDISAFGDAFFVAPIDNTLIVATHPNALKGILQLHAQVKKDAKTAKNVLNHPLVRQAREQLDPKPLVWAWANLEPIKSLDGLKELFVQPRNNFLLTFAFAGWLDVVHRSPYVAAGFVESDRGYQFRLELPSGREGRANDVIIHLPEEEGKSGSLPLLEVPGTIFTHSYYQDLGAMWTHRKKVFNEATAKDFENFEKEASRFLLGTTIEKLFTQLGPHHRFLIVEQSLPAKERLTVRFPAFAQVVSLRNPEIGKSIEAMLRAGGFLAYTQFGTTLFQEKYQGISLFGYRFPENGKFPDDPDGIRFNFVPTFAQVNDQYIFTTSPELCKQLIALLLKSDPPISTSKNMQMRFLSKGVLRNVLSDPETLLTQTILEQGLTAKEAQKQADLLVEYVRKLGNLEVFTDWQPKRFRLELQWNLKE